MKSAKRPAILRTSAAALLALLVAAPMSTQASVLTWTGTVDNFWETNAFSSPTNWNPNNFTPVTDVTVSDLVFTGSKNTNSVNNALPGTVLNSITFDSNAAAFKLSGSQVLFTGGGFITNNSKFLQTISFSDGPGTGGIELTNIFSPTFSFPFTTIPHFTVTAATADILIGSNIAFDAPLSLIVDGAHNTTITGNLYDVGIGGGTLVKNGTGTLTLTGNSTFPGSTTVNSGTLLVNGSIASTQTFVNGGTLGGVGFIHGNVLNSGGNVAPGNSIGTLTVKGNYVQTQHGTLTIEVAGAKSGQHDLLAVSQRATIDGTLRIVNTGAKSLLKPGQSIDILTADKGVSGTFNDITHGDTLVTNRVVYSENAVSIEGISDPFASIPGLTPNQIAVAHALDSVAFRNKQPKLIGFLIQEPVSKLPSDLDKIAPEEFGSIFAIGTSLANVQTANLQRRTDDLRSGSSGFSASGFATAGSGPLYSGGLAGPSGSYDGKESKEVKNVVPPENRWGTFITGVGEWVNVDGDGNARGYDITTGGFTVGADYKVTPNFAVGLMAGYAGTGTHLNDGGRVFVNGGKLGLYSTYFTGGFYVDTAVNGGYNSYDLRRNGLEGTARSSTHGGELNVLFATGYDFKVGGFKIGPTASFQYTYLGLSSFEERGSLAPLRFHAQGQDSVRTAFGMKASYDWKLGGVIVRPELRTAWQHEFGDDRYAIDSSFSDGNGDLFTVNGPVIGRDSLLLGAGFAILWNERTSTYVYYDGELGRSNYSSHNVSGGVRLSF